MNYQEVESKILKHLESTAFCVLATVNKKGEVCASQMCLINDGLTVYVQTDKKFEKVKNITENANVAINAGAFYFKGTAKILGHPSGNARFIEKIKQKHLKTYENYTGLPNEVLIEINLSECKIWGGDNKKDVHNQESILLVDLIHKTLKTIVCDKM